MDENVIDNLITNLKIIEMIKINEKLSIRKGHLQIDYSSNIQFIKRWFNRDSREIIIKYIKDLVKEINNVFKFKHNYSELKLNLLKSCITNTEKGFENLKITYSNDYIMIVNIDLINIKIKDYIKEES